jgi:hypothetical protein
MNFLIIAIIAVMIAEKLVAKADKNKQVRDSGSACKHPAEFPLR